ncbi:MAG: U32 family peptidase [Acholeplasmataceae bacterium]
MKILTTLYDIKSMDELASLVDGFIIGNHDFGARLTHSFSIAEINKAIQKADQLNKDIFLQANQMLDDHLIESFDKFLDDINLDKLSGIVVADLGAVMLLKSKHLAHKAIYNPETLLTNTYDFNFLYKEHILGAYVAKEITLEDVKNIGNNKKIKLFMVGHGHLNMFYSKRQLVNNFMDFVEEDNIYHEKQNLKIIEEQRKDEPYPILEDKAGTHVFRSHVFSSLNHLSELETVVDYLIIDTIFKDDQYAKRILPMYQDRHGDQKLIDSLKRDYQESWDEAFFYKKTVYKTKES